LQNGRDLMADMAKLAKGVGAEFDDVMDAAADVANNLGDVENRGQAVRDVMAAVAGMGKIGAVELKDAAVQMAKIAAQAPQFQGDRAKTIRSLFMLAESSRATGGSASAPQAATAVQQFVATFSKGARLEGFAKLGIDPYDKKTRKIRDFKDIIVEVLNATGGDQRRIDAAFKEQQAKRAFRPFQSIYLDALNRAEGDEKQRMLAAERAVREDMEKYDRALVTQREIQDALAIKLASTQDKMQLFNNKLGEAVSKSVPDLVSAFENMAPVIVGSAKVLGDMVEFLNKKLGEPMDMSHFAAMPQSREAAVGLIAGLEGGMRNATRDASGKLVSQLTPEDVQATAQRASELRRELDHQNGRLAAAKEEGPQKATIDWETRKRIESGTSAFDWRDEDPDFASGPHGYRSNADHARALGIERTELALADQHTILTKLDRTLAEFTNKVTSGELTLRLKGPISVKPSAPTPSIGEGTTESHAP
jgi:hypothetical protein